jgi:thymidylate synthase ThyX
MITIIKDSINESNCRLTTFILEYPRFIHSELLTHRVFSKNAASSRAIPFKKFVDQVSQSPAMPLFWGKNQSGMQAVEELDEQKKQKAIESWLKGRDAAISTAQELDELGVHKQITNRVMEPWFNIRVILSGTDFENFFALRAHQDAMPEIRALAYEVLEKYNSSIPQCLSARQWHIPFGDTFDMDRLRPIAHEVEKEMVNNGVIGDAFQYAMEDCKKKIAVARCARISYLNFEGKDDYNADLALFNRLVGGSPKHLSPCEHVAMSTGLNERIGNFRGFKQYRYFFTDQNLCDERVIKRTYEECKKIHSP